MRLADFGWKCRDSKDCWAGKMDLDLLRNAELKEAFDEFDKVCVCCIGSLPPTIQAAQMKRDKRIRFRDINLACNESVL